MKIKFDFVTNSSSTSYIVFVPKDFIVEKKHITSDMLRYDFGALLKDLEDDWDRAIASLNNGLNILKSGQTLWADWEEIEDCNRASFYTLQQIFKDVGFLLESYESDAEDAKIHNVGIHSKKIGELLIAEMLSNITVKGSNDDTTEDKQ
jgi:hypothetical protein